MNGTWYLRSSRGEGWFELPTGNIEWPHPSAGRHGAATFTIPKGHEAEALVEQRMWATFVDDALGTWPGRVMEPPEWNDGGVEVLCLHVSSMFLRRRCYHDGLLVGLTPGGVVRAAFKAAFGEGADGHVVLGTVLEAPPVVPAYELNGQQFDAVLTEMEKLSGQTWLFEGDTFNWVANTGALYPYVMVQDGDFFMPSRGPLERGDRVGQIIAKDKLGRVAMSPAVSLSVTDDQDEIQLDTISVSELQEAADREVARRAHPTTVFTFILKDAPYGASDDPADRSPGTNRIPMLMINRNAVSAFEHRRRIREGTIFRFVAPRSRTGDAGLGRVISRKYLGDTGLIEVEVEYIRPFDRVTAQAAGRGVSRGPLPRPPSAPGPVVNGAQPKEVDGRLVKGVVPEAQKAEQADTATTAASATTATTATTANGVAAGAVGTAGLANQAVSTDKSGFSTETSPTLSAGSATAIPGNPVTWVWVKDAGGTLRKVPSW